MENTRGILYPALHKFYNALSSLEKFDKGSNFFDNISHLDNFLSEFRNITFVLQKALSNTTFKSTYDKLRKQYLINDVCKWFVDKRNSTVKEHPFDLEKRIVISIYSSEDALCLPELLFTIENDIKFTSVIESLKEALIKTGFIEVFLSAEFIFLERGQNEDLYDNFILGITQMKLFLSEMQKALNEKCSLSKEIQDRIEKMNFYRVPKDFLFADDYVFNCKYEFFERSARIALTSGIKNNRSPIDNLNRFGPNGNIFSQFELMHIVFYQMQKALLPTCMIIFNDDTFELLSFGFSIKTTVYRKFNEIAKRIEKENIINLLFVSEMNTFDIVEIANLDSRERIKHVKNEILAFYMIDNGLTIKSHGFETKRVDDMEYIVSVMSTDPTNQGLPVYLNPIIKEFNRLIAIKNQG